MTLKDGIFLGLAQAIALIPGTSRSGITMTAGLAGKFTRRAATEISFLMAIPVLLAATVYELKELIGEPVQNSIYGCTYYRFCCICSDGIICYEMAIAYCRKSWIYAVLLLFVLLLVY